MALSDPEGILASPFTTINRRDDAAAIEAIIDIVEQKGVERVIVGLPRSMDGSIGWQAERVKAFAQELCSRIKLPVEFRDERLSTVSAKRLRREARKGRGGASDDAIAAAVILQGYLDEGTK